MAGERTDEPTARDPVAQLEKAFITEFLERRGYNLSTIHELPPEQATALLKEASVYASGRLSEVEARAHLLADLHDAGRPEAAHPHERKR
jgi:hypothetical protein